MDSMTNIIEVNNLCKQFKVQRREAGLAKALKTFFSQKYEVVDAVKDISFNIEKGEFIGMIGPNGAGKSTTIKIMTGILVPSSGNVKVMGYCPWDERLDYVKNIGVVFGQRTQLWWDLPPVDSFELLKHIYDIPEHRFKKNLEKFSEVLEINKLMDIPVRKLSLGERMRCDLAASLLHDPKVLFLDEPTIGLDVVAKEKIRNFLKETNKEKKTTIILTTHDMGDIEELCPRIIIIDKGQKLYDGSVAEIKKKFGKERMLIVDFVESIHPRFDWKGVRATEIDAKKFKFLVDTRMAKISDVTKRILSKYQVHDITVEEPDIEEIIRDIYRRGLRA